LTTIDPIRDALPMRAALPALAAALADHPRVLLHAPPGAGKSTLVPIALLDAGWLARRKVLMLEPRRVAARAIAARVAQLLGEPVGRRIGFRTRLETRVGAETRVEVVTEGILTRMLQHDAALPGVGCVVFDEFHERSIHADLGLALALECQETLRPDLRVLVMSATLDVAPLARLLGDPPIVGASGRSFEVQTRHVVRRAELDLERQVAQVVLQALREEPGGALCFLPGTAEIRRVERLLVEGGGPAGMRVLPLYGELDAAAQDAALAPAASTERRVVLATSIAETSLTIDGVRIVVDAGLSRYSEFDPTTGMSRLATVKVSQAAADQRRGRAGRLAPGVCYRLWSEGAHAQLAPYTQPEILRADLAPLALELALWGSADAATLRWLDAPPAAHLAQARDLLRRLEAIDERNRITDHGRAMARLGAHPRLAHMLARAAAFGGCRLACDLAAILGERDVVRTRPGAREADIRVRLAALAEDGAPPPGIELDHGAIRRAARSAADWRRDLRCGQDSADRDRMAGALLALAYPDRIGRARGHDGRYLLANGRGARFGEVQALAKAPYLVAAALDDGEREARIFLAAPVEADDLERLFAARIHTQAEVVWDDRLQAVRARRERRLDALVLESAELPDPDPQRVLGAMLDGMRRMGVGALPWTRELRQFQARVALLRRCAVPADAPWPDLGDEALLADLDEWAPPWLAGFSRREHLAHLPLRQALAARLTHAQAATLAREAPTHLRVPSGSNVPIDYLDGEDPTVSVRLQEVFGLTATPDVAAGRVRVLLKLLSPAGRPVQVTRDLVSFWDRGYHEVKRDLKGRYPRHYWPDDPHQAEPTRRVRPPGRPR
jgi:ATP-dependent RNA helicase HrpB